MKTIARREPVAGAERWEWPAHVEPVLRRVLSRRRLESPDEIELGLKNLEPVSAFTSLTGAVELLHAHRGSRIVVVGDFDADGATSTALMLLVLRALGFADVDFFIPDRFELGYGLTREAVERVAERDPALIVTVDNGISSVDGVAAARERGIDVLVTDHHLPPAELPAATAIVNPNLDGDPFPGKDLAGVGVVFYMLAALARELGDAAIVARHLDLVALGTVADLVALDRGNRILVAQGIERIRAGACRPGMRALVGVAGRDPADVTAATLGFQLGPRLNAAGRLDDMSVGVRCLVTDSEREAGELAGRLDALNRERRELESRMQAEAVAAVEAGELDDAAERAHVVCLSRDDWHEGLVGLVASRVKERCHRPTFAFARAGDGRLKGSGRSIRGFHLRDALADVDAAHPGLITRFGGHAMAAGLTLDADRFEAFAAAVDEVGRCRLDAAALEQTIYTDGELAAEEMSLTVARALRDGGPWGQGFPEPTFDGVFTLVASSVLKGAHLRMQLKPAAGADEIEAIAFNRAEPPGPPGTELRLVYRLELNDYYAQPRVQLVVEHVEPAG